VRSEQSAERRVYHLTDAGRAELEARAEDLQAFWAARLAGPPAMSAAAQRHPEIDFVAEEMDALSRTVWGGLRNVVEQNDLETVRRVRQAIERCRGEIREIIAESASPTGQV
jgi:DNA-binding PadR family transcriptional regulator